MIRFLNRFRRDGMTMLEARPSAVVVRPARAEDRRLLESGPGSDAGETLVAVRGGAVLGRVNITAIPGSRDTAVVSGLFVRPGHRGQGVARMLVRGACANIVARGCDWAIATVAPEDDPVRRLLSSCGWRPDPATGESPLVYRRQVLTHAFTR